MKILGVIPSRYESSRFPGKPLIDLKGKSMIQRVYEQCEKSKLLDKVIIATDDERIFKHCQSFGNVVMTSILHQSGTDRCNEVLNNEKEFDIVINIQGDEPLIKPEQIDQLCGLMLKDGVTIGTLIKPFSNKEDVLNRNRIKAVVDTDFKALYFSRSPIPFTNETFTPSEYWRHIGLYGYHSKVLNEITQLKPSFLEKQESLEQLRWLENGYSINTAQTLIETPNIDSPEDVEAVLKLL